MANRPGEKPQFGFGTVPQQGWSGPGGGLAGLPKPGDWPPVRTRLIFERPRIPRTDAEIAEACRVQADPRLTVSSTDRTTRQQAIQRAFFMAESPMAGALYGLSALANLSPQQRDIALAAGGVVDALSAVVIPRGVPRRATNSHAAQHEVTQNVETPAIRMRPLNERGQAQGVNATVSKGMIGTGKPAGRKTPPGWRGPGNETLESRGHLQANDLGGTGDPRNVVLITQNPTNSPHMSRFDEAVKRRVLNGEIMETSTIPLYTPDALAPKWILQTAYGPLSGPTAQLVYNPAGRPQ